MQNRSDALIPALWLQDLNLRMRELTQESDTVAEGHVITTDPAPFVEAEPETYVRVFISTGPQKFAIPNVRIADPRSCQCGEVLKGVIKP